MRPDLDSPRDRAATPTRLEPEDRRVDPPESAGALKGPRDPLGRLQQLTSRLARANRPLPVVDLCAGLRGARTKTVERLLGVLVRLGYVEQVETGWRECR